MKVIGRIRDNQGPFCGVSHERKTARGIVLDDNGRIALIHRFGTIHGDSIDSYLTPGGGIEAGERPEQAVLREIREELGLECQITHRLGITVDFFNRIRRRTVSYYYILKPLRKTETSLTPKELLLMKGVEWLPMADALKLLEGYSPDPRGVTLHKREICAIQKAGKILGEEG